MFGFFKKKPKSEYAEAVLILLSYSSLKITSDGHKLIADHEKSARYSWMFTAGFVFMNGICNRLCDEIGDGTGDPMSMLKTLEITSESTGFIQSIMEDQIKSKIMNDKEVEFLLDLQGELITQPGIKFQRMLELGKLAVPK